MAIELNSLASLRALYEDVVLPRYKTVSARKACLTRDIKAHSAMIEEVRAALSREGASRGWYLGERYYPHHLAHYYAELVELQNIRQSL